MAGTTRLVLGRAWRLASACTSSLALIWASSTLDAQTLPILEARLELTIGEQAGDEYIFGRIASVAAATDGRIYVLDAQVCVAKVFAPTGRFARTIAGRGGGPGEFQCPGSELSVRAGELVSTNSLSGRFARYTLDGAHIATEQQPRGTDGAANTRVYRLRNDVDIVVTRALLGYARGSETTRFHTVSGRVGGRRTETLARYREHSFYYAPSNDDSFVLTAGSGFGNGGAWAFSGDSLVALADGYTGVVVWMKSSPNGLVAVRRDSIDGAGRPVTLTELRALAERTRSGDRTGRFVNAELRFLDVQTKWSVAHRAFFAEDGTLWVGGVPQSGATRWVAFPVSGAPFAVLVPSDFWLSTANGNRLYGYANGAADGPVVRVYRIVRP